MNESTRTVRDPHLGKLHSRVEEIERSLAELPALSREALTWKPDEGSWGIVEVVDHLLITGRLYNARIEATIDRLHADGRTASDGYRPGIFARFFIRLVDPASGKKFKAPRAFRPAQADVDPSVIAEFQEQQREFARLIVRADGYDLNRPKFASPVSRLIRLSVGEGLTLMVAHQRRHMGQIDRLRAHPSFPEE